MKKLLHKTMSLLMAFVVLFSTMSFAIDMHYCGGTLVETAIFQKTKGCGMDSDNYRKQKPTIEGCTITKTDCCKNEQTVVDGQDELQLHVDKISFEQQVFIASFVCSYMNCFEGSVEKTTAFEKYEPPLVVRQIFKRDETYII